MILLTSRPPYQRVHAHSLLSIACLLALTSWSVLGGTACNRLGDEAEVDVATQAVYSADQTSAEAELLLVLLGDLDPSQSPEDLAAEAAGSATEMEPPDCVTAQTSGAQVTWTFSQCTGPYAMATVDGDVTATFAPARAGVRVTLESSGLEINSLPVTLSATVRYGIAGNSQTLDVTVDSSAQTARFGDINRTGAYTVTLDSTPSCVSVVGTWDTSLGTRSWTTTTPGFTACEGSCLEGSLTFSRVGASYSLTFAADGSVAWSTSGGKSGTLQTGCGQ